jgi:crossover junction endodeoxyribonuclease RuvC
LAKERIILGIDPGTQVMGYGLIRVEGNHLEVIHYGVIELHKLNGQALKLKRIYERVSQLIEHYAPDEIALEAPFYGKNVQSMLKLGRAQGVAMAAALTREIPVVEYAPRKIKQSITGNGNASKEQVAAMLEKLLNIRFEDNTLLDATDALGVAVCHYLQSGLQINKSKSWDAFVKENPHRIKKSR